MSPDGLREVLGLNADGFVAPRWLPDLDAALVEPPAVQGIRRVFVGGPLHGRVCLVPAESTSVFALPPEIDLDRLANDQIYPFDNAGDRSWFAVYGMIEYGARCYGNTQLMIDVEMIRSADKSGKGSGLRASIVDALGHAADVHGPSGSALVASISTTD